MTKEMEYCPYKPLLENYLPPATPRTSTGLKQSFFPVYKVYCQIFNLLSALPPRYLPPDLEPWLLQREKVGGRGGEGGLLQV